MTKSALFPTILALVLASVACGPTEVADPRLGASGRDGTDGKPCTVTENDDGSATITCPDGTSATVRAPEPEPGEPGPQGPQGEPGEPGAPGPSGGVEPTCDVLEGDLVIETSADVDTFKLLGCRRVAGSITVSEQADLSSLDGLASLEEVDGDVRVSPCITAAGQVPCEKRLDLVGLANVQRIGGNLHIGRNVVDVSFASLVEVGGLTVIGLDAQNIDGFAHVTTIGNRGLQIRQMPNIVNLAGLRSLRSVAGDVFIVDNPQLPQCVVTNELDDVAIAGAFVTSGNNGIGDCSL